MHYLLIVLIDTIDTRKNDDVGYVSLLHIGTRITLRSEESFSKGGLFTEDSLRSSVSSDGPTGGLLVNPGSLRRARSGWDRDDRVHNQTNSSWN